MTKPNADESYLQALGDHIEESHQILSRVKDCKCFSPPSGYANKKIFVAIKTEDGGGKSKLYYESDPHETLFYLLRGNEPKYVFYQKRKIAIIENCEILYYVETNNYNRPHTKTYINPNCDNLIRLCNKSNNTLKSALEEMGKVPYVKDHTDQLPDWAKDFLTLS